MVKLITVLNISTMKKLFLNILITILIGSTVFFAIVAIIEINKPLI